MIAQHQDNVFHQDSKEPIYDINRDIRIINNTNTFVSFTICDGYTEISIDHPTHGDMLNKAHLEANITVVMVHTTLSKIEKYFTKLFKG